MRYGCTIGGEKCLSEVACERRLSMDIVMWQAPGCGGKFMYMKIFGKYLIRRSTPTVAIDTKSSSLGYCVSHACPKTMEFLSLAALLHCGHTTSFEHTKTQNNTNFPRGFQALDSSFFCSCYMSWFSIWYLTRTSGSCIVSLWAITGNSKQNPLHFSLTRAALLPSRIWTSDYSKVICTWCDHSRIFLIAAFASTILNPYGTLSAENPAEPPT